MRGPDEVPEHHPNESIEKMTGELLREGGILLLVFAALESKSLSGWVLAVWEVLGALAIGIGVMIERGRKR